MNDGKAHDFQQAANDPQNATPAPPAHTTINRDGSGHTIHAEQGLGTIVLGVIALILLTALLRSEARYRALQAKLLRGQPTS